VRHRQVTQLIKLTLRLVAATALVSASRPAAATLCAPARAAPGTASLPEPWRQALEALVEASAAEGQPWGCAGGVIDLVPRPDGRGATLVVTAEDGHRILREVTLPDEVVPLGEALLSRPLPSRPPTAPPPTAPPPPSGPPGEERLATRVDAGPLAGPAGPPRALVGAVLGPRYGGKSDVVWGSVTAGLVIPFGAWGAGVWGRYDGLPASFDAAGGPMREGCIGASASRTFALGPVELRAAVLPSIAVVSRSHGIPRGMPLAKPVDDETGIDGRIGAGFTTVIPFTSVLRGVVALDAEVAPAQIAGDSHGHDPDAPMSSLPAYTVGLGLGLELAVR
jgi:hypothetical protein